MERKPSGESVTPRVDNFISDLVAGKDSRFLASLVADPNSSSGGYLTYEPLAYSKSLLITVTNPGALYYNVGYKTFVSRVPVATWTGSENSSTVRDPFADVFKNIFRTGV